MEVAQWSALRPEDKQHIWERLEQRRRLGGLAGRLGGALDLVAQDGQEWALIWHEGFTKLLFRFEEDGTLRLSLPDSGQTASLGGGDEVRLLDRAKRWLADCQLQITG